MNLKRNPREVAEQILKRSICTVQVGAVVADGFGIFSWGWNSSGDGYGWHAEYHCLYRANRRRLAGATLYVAAIRQRNNKVVSAKPCLDCQKLVKICKAVLFRDKDGEWREL